MADTKANESIQYGNLSRVLDAPLGESEEQIGRVIAAVGNIADKTGLIDELFRVVESKQGGAGLTAADGVALMTKALRGAGVCIGDVVELVSAVNGMDRNELAAYPTRKVIAMAKAIITDPGFFSSLRDVAD